VTTMPCANCGKGTMTNEWGDKCDVCGVPNNVQVIATGVFVPKHQAEQGAQMMPAQAVYSTHVAVCLGHRSWSTNAGCIPCEITTLKADLAAALERVGEFQAENANLRAATRGRTMYHSDEDVNKEMGLLREERDQLKRERDEYRDFLHPYARDVLKKEQYRQGFEDCREAVVGIVEGDGWNHCSCVDNHPCASCGTVNEILEDIRALTVPERGEKK